MADWILISSFALILVAGGGALYLLYPLVPSDLGGAPNLDHEARRVRIPVAGDDWVAGWFLAGRRPATIVVFHGYGRNHHRAWRYAAFLHRSGYHVLAIDFRSSRYRARKPTTLGHFELPDAQAALDWVRAEPSTQTTRIALLAESLGAAVALIVAAANSDVDALVVDCPFATGQQALEDSCERWARLPRWPSAEILRSLGRAATGRDPADLNPLTACRLLADRPIFFIHAENDNRFSVEQTRALWEAAGAKDPLWLIPGIGHNEGWKKHRRLYEGRVTSFLARHLFGEGEGLPPGELATHEEPAVRAGVQVS